MLELISAMEGIQQGKEVRSEKQQGWIYIEEAAKGSLIWIENGWDCRANQVESWRKNILRRKWQEVSCRVVAHGELRGSGQGEWPGERWEARPDQREIWAGRRTLAVTPSDGVRVTWSDLRFQRFTLTLMLTDARGEDVPEWVKDTCELEGDGNSPGERWW